MTVAWPIKMKVQLLVFVVQLLHPPDFSLSVTSSTLSSLTQFAMFKGILPGTSKRISNSEFMMVTPQLEADFPDPAVGKDKENIKVYAPKMVPPKSAPASKMHKRTFSQAAPKDDTNLAFEELLVSGSFSFTSIRLCF